MSDQFVYCYLMDNRKPLTKEVIEAHVAYLKQLSNDGQLVLCGPFSDYPGGMVIVRATSLEQAISLAEKDPLIACGYKDYHMRTLEVANVDNGFLLGK